MKIVITRREEDSESLVEAAKKADLKSLCFPCLEITEPSDNYKSLEDSIRKNHLYDWIFFLSKNAADSFFTRLIKIGGQFFNLAPHLKIGVVGSSTAKFIKEEVGFPVDFIPSEFNSDSFVEEFLERYSDPKALPGSDKKKLLLIRAELDDESFKEKIEASGQFELDTALAYKTQAPAEYDLEELKSFIEENSQDVFISFASSDTVRNFKVMTEELELFKNLNKASFSLESQKSPKGLFFLSIGPKTSQTIKEEFSELDLPNILLEAGEATMESMISLCLQLQDKGSFC